MFEMCVPPLRALESKVWLRKPVTGACMWRRRSMPPRLTTSPP